MLEYRIYGTNTPRPSSIFRIRFDGFVVIVDVVAIVDDVDDDTI